MTSGDEQDPGVEDAHDDSDQDSDAEHVCYLCNKPCSNEDRGVRCYGPNLESALKLEIEGYNRKAAADPSVIRRGILATGKDGASFRKKQFSCPKSNTGSRYFHASCAFTDKGKAHDNLFVRSKGGKLQVGTSACRSHQCLDCNPCPVRLSGAEQLVLNTKREFNLLSKKRVVAEAAIKDAAGPGGSYAMIVKDQLGGVYSRTHNIDDDKKKIFKILTAKFQECRGAAGGALVEEPTPAQTETIAGACYSPTADTEVMSL